MTTWTCPKCGYRTSQPLGHEVWHRCPKTRRDVKLTAEQDDDA